MTLSLTPEFETTLFAQSQAIQNRRTTCREVFERCRATVVERESSVQAWIRFGGDEVEQAVRDRDRELKNGQWRGPLHGIPVGVKDIYDVAEAPTLAGIPNRQSDPAERDSAMVARLREAGAIIVGKTVTTPYAYFDPPPTRNPWNLDRTPGGSSSGSAAAIASGMCLGALGSQTGGSILRPASFCGIAGYKPTFGLLNRRGMFPFAPSLDHPGPMARTVTDLILLMTALAPPFLRESFQALPNERLVSDLEALPNFVVPEGDVLGKTEPAMSAAMDATTECLRHMGAMIVREPADELELPKLWTQHRCVMAVEIATTQDETLEEHPEEFTPAVRALIEEGLATRSVDYAAAIQFQRALRRRMSRAIGDTIWLMPAARGAAPTQETTGDPCMNSPWSFLGFPTITIPMALSPEGLPLGLQLVAGPGQDIELFRVARWCESILVRR
ncbi:MAG: amidase [Planctomycetaceae bacterium]|nr:amidase [Planctomycetaceae bacterium]